MGVWESAVGGGMGEGTEQGDGVQMTMLGVREEGVGVLGRRWVVVGTRESGRTRRNW